MLVAVAAGALVLAVPSTLACADHVGLGFWGRALDSLTAAAARPPRPVVDEAKEQQRPNRLRWITGSRYEKTTDVRVLHEQGCRSGRRQQNGLVVLAFGKPSHNGRSYGTILFSNRFASNAQITRATRAYATGYAACLPEGSPAAITLARGTSNYRPSVPSTFTAGRRWARETMRFARYLRLHPGVGAHVRAAAGIDAEPSWDRGFRGTRRFFSGFRSARTGYLLYNFGSLDGGVGAIWSLRQAFYVAGGMRDARVVPEIYYSSQARQWAHLARLAQKTYGRSVRFAGVMTQHSAGCGCGLTPLQAHRTLRKELAGHRVTRPLVRTLASVTNIN